MKSTVSVLIILAIFVMIVSCNDDAKSFNGFIIWKYNDRYDFAYLQSKTIDERGRDYGELVRIPLSDYTTIYWDEQVYVMDWNYYKKNYRDIIDKEYGASDRALFFSLVVNNAILFDGVVRTAPEAAMKKYDDAIIPKFYGVTIEGNNSNLIYSRISLASSDNIVLESIWDEAKQYNLDISFLNTIQPKQKIMKKPRILYGRYDLYEVMKVTKPIRITP